MRYPPAGYEPIDRAALIAQAKQYARRLRHEAVSDCWDGAGANCAKVARSLSRLLSRLARHRQSRVPMRVDSSKTKAT